MQGCGTSLVLQVYISPVAHQYIHNLEEAIIIFILCLLALGKCWWINDDNLWCTFFPHKKAWMNINLLLSKKAAARYSPNVFMTIVLWIWISHERVQVSPSLAAVLSYLCSWRQAWLLLLSFSVMLMWAPPGSIQVWSLTGSLVNTFCATFNTYYAL